MTDKHQAETATPKLKEFILQIRSSPASLDRGWKSDFYHINVFRNSTWAILLQFHAPDLALILFTSRPERQDLTVEIAFDGPLSAVPEELPRKIENCQPLALTDSLGRGKVSLREFLERETKFLLGGAVERAVSDSSGFSWHPAEDVAVYYYPGLVALMNVSAVLQREYALAETARNRPYPSRSFFEHTGRARRAFAGRFTKIEQPNRTKTFRSSEGSGMTWSTGEQLQLSSNAATV